MKVLKSLWKAWDSRCQSSTLLSKLAVAMPLVSSVLWVSLIPEKSFFVWDIVSGLMALVAYAFILLYLIAKISLWLTKDEEKREEMKADLTVFEKPNGFLSIVLLATLPVMILAANAGGDTAMPITNIDGIYLNEKLDVADLLERGFELEADGNGYTIKDASRPEVTYEVEKDPSTGLVYAVDLTMQLSNNDNVNALFAMTLDIWDAKYGGANQGLRKRYYDDVSIFAYPDASEHVVKIKLEKAGVRELIEAREEAASEKVSSMAAYGNNI